MLKFAIYNNILNKEIVCGGDLLMANLNEKTIIGSDELKKYFVFEKDKLVLQDKHGKQNIYYFIIFKSLSTHKMTVTSYSRYLLIYLINLKPNTVNYNAKIVV